MTKALIITSYLEHIERVKINPDDYDAIFCADAGLLIAEKLGLPYDYLIGDYDTMEAPDNPDAICLPAEKDMTDTEAAVDLAYSKGFRDITVLGGLGGRFDHTMGNVGVLARYTPLCDSVCLIDGQNRVMIMTAGEMKVYKDGYKYMGLISYGRKCEGISLRRTKYLLENAALSNDTSLGVSNEITGEYAEIKLQSGQLLIIQSNDL